MDNYIERGRYCSHQPYPVLLFFGGDCMWKRNVLWWWWKCYTYVCQAIDFVVVTFYMIGSLAHIRRTCIAMTWLLNLFYVNTSHTHSNATSQFTNILSHQQQGISKSSHLRTRPRHLLSRTLSSGETQPPCQNETVANNTSKDTHG